jgi:hypothetical protein
MAQDYCANQYGGGSGPLTSSLTHVEDVTPDDDVNLDFLTTALINQDDVAHDVAVLMADGEAATLTLPSRLPFPVRVWRVLETGTDAFTVGLQAGDCRVPAAAPAEA